MYQITPAIAEKSITILLIKENNTFKDHDGCTPLHSAAREGHLSLCESIIKRVRNKNPKDRKGWTPLHLAGRNGHLPIFRLFKDHVDDINPKGNMLKI